MNSRGRHPEVLALALIVLALAAGPMRTLPAPDDPCSRLTEIEARLLEKAYEIQTRLAEIGERLASRLGARLGSRLESPRLPTAWLR